MEAVNTATARHSQIKSTKLSARLSFDSLIFVEGVDDNFSGV